MKISPEVSTHVEDGMSCIQEYPDTTNTPDAAKSIPINSSDSPLSMNLFDCDNLIYSNEFTLDSIHAYILEIFSLNPDTVHISLVLQISSNRFQNVQYNDTAPDMS
jgi:hypothetical protein